MRIQQENGRWGEDLAADYLARIGFTILERNWHFKHAEVDIIAIDKGVLVLVEVKARSSDTFGKPEEMVNARKRALMAEAGAAFARRIRHEWEIRFDIIGITGEPGRNARVEHFKDAFYPGMG